MFACIIKDTMLTRFGVNLCKLCDEQVMAGCFIQRQSLDSKKVVVMKDNSGKL